MELLSGIAEIYRDMGFYRQAGLYYKWAVTCSGKETALEYANKVCSTFFSVLNYLATDLCYRFCLGLQDAGASSTRL